MTAIDHELHPSDSTTANIYAYPMP
jgi:hypothetical protein